jgi:hypothetical protein
MDGKNDFSMLLNEWEMEKIYCFSTENTIFTRRSPRKRDLYASFITVLCLQTMFYVFCPLEIYAFKLVFFCVTQFARFLIDFVCLFRGECPPYF